jgi:dipeptidyl aminopeptidase/acylaminoacyl peptidase
LAHSADSSPGTGSTSSKSGKGRGTDRPGSFKVVINGRVAFVSSETNGAQSDLYTMNPDGSDRKQLTFSQEHEGEPTWSPDGTKIAFASLHLTGNGGYSEIFVMINRFCLWGPSGVP